MRNYPTLQAEDLQAGKKAILGKIKLSNDADLDAWNDPDSEIRFDNGAILNVEGTILAKTLKKIEEYQLQITSRGEAGVPASVR